MNREFLTDFTHPFDFRGHARQKQLLFVLSKGKTVEKNLKWELGNNIVTPTDQTKHLGIIRSGIKENEINIEDRLTPFYVFQLQLEGLQLADEWRKEQSFVTVIEICVGSCYGTFLAG
jgi:hypothetical protein